MIRELKDTSKAASLFTGWQDSVVWSAVQGVMGKIYVDSLENPESGAVMLGDFCFLSGKPTEEMTLFCPEDCESEELILVPQNEEWAQMIENCYGEKAVKTVRYAITKEPGIFDLEKLRKAAESLPGEYEMKLIDQNLFEICRNTQWSKALAVNYEDYTQYERFGLGVAILKDGEVVAGISSYSGYHGGIEIEVVTREDYRRKGLAYIGAARLLLECDKRGLYPNWDAANKMSVGLAEKLGYHFSHEYFVYKVKR
ncbi:GNAT family N-acetyltransferase [Blautia sp. Sow4_E7]|uniref:GNAT family N-acetyltransferase n=1 Tax=Blautia sp. Sow4_E7 TaxID=3438749 RepID=UPI003F90D178